MGNGRRSGRRDRAGVVRQVGGRWGRVGDLVGEVGPERAPGFRDWRKRLGWLSERRVRSERELKMACVRELERGRTVAEVAQATGLSRMTVWRWGRAAGVLMSGAEQEAVDELREGS
jgi:Homeodomain-like domain